MPKVDNVAAAKPNRTANVLLWMLAGLAGAGAAGNGVSNYMTSEELARSRDTVNELNLRLSNEQSLNLQQARQMAALNQDLVQSRSNVTNLNQQLLQSQSNVQNLTTRLAELNREFGTRITLDHLVTAVSMITPSTVKVEGQFGHGSGVILFGSNGERFILTNGHVTQQNELRKNLFQDGVFHIKVYNGSDYKNPVEFDAQPVILSNGNRAFSAPGEHDLALLAIPPDVKLPANVVPIRFRDINANPLRVGEPVIVVGNPFAERDSVSFGSISHVDRSSDLNINHHLQTDAPINPGNSGGGLFSIRVENGRPIVELVGINTWTYRGADGLGGSIRVDYVQQVLNSWGINLR